MERRQELSPAERCSAYPTERRPIVSTSSTVLLPWALEKSSGDVVEAKVVAKTRRPFACLACNEELVLKRGQIREAHFAHKADSSCTGGSLESWQHKLAKQILKEGWWQWSFSIACPTCASISETRKLSSDAGTDAICLLELPYGKYRVDAMIADPCGVPKIAVEIFYTHATDEEKKNHFRERQLPLYEIKATDVIDGHEKKIFSAVAMNVQKLCESCEKRKKFETENRRCPSCKEWLRVDSLWIRDICFGCHKRSQRPCVVCKQWEIPKTMFEVDKPPNFPKQYPVAYAHPHCCKDCENCGSPVRMTAPFSRCDQCDKTVYKVWQNRVDEALQMRPGDVEFIRDVISAKPPGIDCPVALTISLLRAEKVAAVREVEATREELASERLQFKDILLQLDVLREKTEILRTENLNLRGALVKAEEETRKWKGGIMEKYFVSANEEKNHKKRKLDAQMKERTDQQYAQWREKQRPIYEFFGNTKQNK